MNTTKVKLINIFIVIAVLLTAFQLILAFGISSTNAGNLWEMQEGMQSEIGDKAFGQSGTPKDIRLVVAGFIRVFLGILGIVFTILVMAAGYMWMTAGGNDEQVNKAKSQLTRAVIGLIVILMAWFIASFAVGCLSDITSDNFFDNICP